jgi:CRP/FNR family transcriptional regulator/CRP/FNR family cyclic AMP-dependent transcriptional regulator
LEKVRANERAILAPKEAEMAPQADLEVLRRSLLLHGLPEVELERLVPLLRRRAFRRGQVAFHQGDPGQVLHLVCQGYLKILVPDESGEEALLTIVGPGDLFGEMALLDGGPRSATVIALEAVETLTLDRADFLVLLRTSPVVVESLLAALARTIRRLSDAVLSLMYLDLRSRLVKKLIELAEAHGHEAHGSIEIQVSLTQEELADMIGATRPRVNMLLGFFENRGAIIRRGRRLVIQQPGELRRWT